MARLAAPPVGGLLITYSSDALEGYHRLFALTVALYLAGVGLSFVLPPDPGGRPFRIRRALFPGRDQRDWRYVMLASATLSGTFEISTFLLGLLMYMQTSDELRVGSYSSYQALVGIIVSFVLGRAMLPESRRRHLWMSSWLLALSGLLFLAPVSGATLMAFGLLRAVALATFGIAHYSLRMEIIANSAEAPEQRIEYLSAWEVPLALGRVVMMLALWGLAAWVAESEYGIRIILIALCAARMLTYYFLAQTSPLRWAR
jgi:YQGE family putative transporter